jgi:crotonobetainyl-CoA:carnitine CoA-transferase CaiB-like acyl-CoA transferase
VRLAERLGLQPIVDVDGVAQVASPWRMSATPVEYRHAPPALGADEQAVRRWLERPAGADEIR